MTEQQARQIVERIDTLLKGNPDPYPEDGEITTEQSSAAFVTLRWPDDPPLVARGLDSPAARVLNEVAEKITVNQMGSTLTSFAHFD